MRKNSYESLTTSSTTQDFINELAKNIANFIVSNRAAFSKEDSEALGEYLSASIVEEVKSRTLELMENPQDIKRDSVIPEEDEIGNTETTELPKDTEDELVSQDIMNLLDKE